MNKVGTAAAKQSPGPVACSASWGHEVIVANARKVRLIGKGASKTTGWVQTWVLLA